MGFSCCLGLPNHKLYSRVRTEIALRLFISSNHVPTFHHDPRPDVHSSSPRRRPSCLELLAALRTVGSILCARAAVALRCIAFIEKRRGAAEGALEVDGHRPGDGKDKKGELELHCRDGVFGGRFYRWQAFNETMNGIWLQVSYVVLER